MHHPSLAAGHGLPFRWQSNWEILAARSIERLRHGAIRAGMRGVFYEG